MRIRLTESIANVVFGLNVWGWAVLGVVSASPEARTHPVRVSIAILHVAVGALLIGRSRARRFATAGQLAKAVPALLLSGLVFSRSPECVTWGTIPQVLFVTGTATAIVSLAWLHRNFAIFPAARGVTTGGPYQIVRHPAYTGELMMVGACCLARPDLTSAGLVVVICASVGLRIHAEESLLAAATSDTSEAYSRYRDHVKYRLIPGVW